MLLPELIYANIVNVFLVKYLYSVTNNKKE